MDLIKSSEKNLTFVRKTHNASSAHHIRNSGIKLRVSHAWPKGLEKYTKFIVVRHPMDRLVSAYYNLVNYTKGMGDHASYVVEYFQKKKNLDVVNWQTLSFEQFLTEITTHNAIYNDRHWNPISDTCSICIVKYDYLLRLETIFGDFQPISNILGHPFFKLEKYGALNGNKKRQRSVSHENGLNWSKYLPQYRNVSKNVLKKVLKRYQYDLNLFGYYFNTSTYIASCSISQDGETPLC